MMDTTTHNPLINKAEIGDILSNRYRVLQIIKSEEGSQIYLTEDISLLHDNVCLLKRYDYSQKQSPLAKQNKKLFETELNCLRLLDDCPHIPHLLDNFEDEYSLSLIEELIEGDLVSKLLPLSINAPNCWLELNVLEFLKDTLEILTYLNQKDLIHGNIKPDNILQRKKDLGFCLIDFAYVQKISDLDNPFKKLLPFSHEDSTIHSPYCAPEQILGQIKVNSDLYALGIISIQALTGIDISQLELSIETKELNWLEIWRAHPETRDFFLSDEFLPILNKLVAPDVKNRYVSAQSALQDINNLIAKKTAQIIIFTEEQWPGLSFSPSYYLSDFITSDLEIAEDSEDEKIVLDSIESDQELLEVLENNGQKNVNNKPSKNLKIDSKWLKVIGGIGLTGLLIYATVIYFGLGTILKVLGLEPSAKQLLQAQEIYDAGDLKGAIALVETIEPQSPIYEESRTILQQWQSELEQQNKHLEKVRLAFDAQQWETVLQEAKKVPLYGGLKNELNSLVTQAKENLDQEAKKLFQQAINYAEAQDFGQALFYLKQIPLESSLGELVKTKLGEYEEKRNIRDHYNFQQAINSAQQREFLTAISFLQKIDPDGPKGSIAQQKIMEYTQMENIKNTMQRRQGKFSPVINFNPGSVLHEIHN